ncbi:Obscurin [Orchesella cincta]|uniref:Obscurin n=1 Tax=Orchesella cincta TaxID=48709 RepID=A0A1D2MN30_ORCCI|nr:Obscurin [Orchesella cincta]
MNDDFGWTRFDLNNQSHDNLEENFITKNKSDYVISEDVNRVLFTCKAKYPIKVTIPYPEQFTLKSPKGQVATVSDRLSVFNEDLNEPITQSYVLRIVIVFGNVKFFSSTLTCQSVDKPAINSSFHMFKLSYDGIERRGETIQVSVDPSHNPMQVELPCRPASPSSTILLQKQTQISVWKDGKFESVATWENIKWTTFDPKKGITLTLPEYQVSYETVPPSIFGLYKCILNGSENDEEHVFVNVSRKTEENKNDAIFHLKSSLKRNAKVGFLKQEEKQSYDTFICCSGVRSHPPLLNVINCDSLFECDVEKLSIPTEPKENTAFGLKSLAARPNKTDCTTDIVYGISSIIFCKGENIDFLQQYFHLLNPPQPLAMHNDSHRRVTDSAAAPSPNFYVPHSVSWNADIERKIVVSIGRPEDENAWEAGATERHAEYFYNHRYIFEDEQGQLSISMSKRQSIVQVNADIYEGEIINCMCFGLTLFHSYGGYLRSLLKGLTNDLIFEYGTDADYIITSVDFSDSYLKDSLAVNPIFGKPITASRDITSVECFQPVWNSSKWEKMEIPMEIKASSELVFSGPVDEIVYFNLFQKESEITCQLSQGEPQPESILVTKDDKSLVLTDENGHIVNAIKSIIVSMDEATNLVTIKFLTISYETHGIYKCTASNVRGKAEKIIRVFVSEKSNIFLIASIFIGVMIAICLGLGIIRLWAQRRKLQFFQSH